MPDTNAPTPQDCSFTLTVRSPCDHWPSAIYVDFDGDEEITPELEAEIIRGSELAKAIDKKVPDQPVIGPAPS